MAFTEYRYSEAVRTRAEMQAEYGSCPPSRTWTINRAHASVTWVTDDGGEHWAKQRVVHAAQRAQRDLASLARDES